MLCMLSAVLPAPRPSGSPRIWTIPPLAASLVLLCAAVGSLVLAGFAAVALVPLVFTLALGLGWVLALLLLCWAGIETLAALERWFENDPRFHR